MQSLHVTLAFSSKYSSPEDDPCNASLLLRLKTAKISGFANALIIYSRLKKNYAYTVTILLELILIEFE